MKFMKLSNIYIYIYIYIFKNIKPKYKSKFKGKWLNGRSQMHIISGNIWAFNFGY